MPISSYVKSLRARIGRDLLLLPAVTAVIRDGDRLLLARQHGSDMWGLVGGGIEPGEEPADAVAREVLEEIGVQPAVGRVIGAYGGEDLVVEYANGDRVGYTTIAFECALPPGAPIEFVDGELAEARWFTLAEIGSLPRHPGIDRMLRDAVGSAGAAANASRRHPERSLVTHPDHADADGYSDITERFITAFYPGATIAVVAGSTARGERTVTSDIDLLLIGDTLFEDAETTSAAATHAFDDEIFEVFAYTPSGFTEWAERDVSRHRPVIVHMLVEGAAVLDDGRLDGLRREWRAVLEAGPFLTAEDSAFRRYVITDLLDDLRDAIDPLERRAVASALFERIAELMLLSDHRWIATGKWLPRRLRALSASRADRLATPFLEDDYDTFADRVEAELERAGGRVQAGFVR
ncbi:NUDIX domain-containing protein [Microbacterium sp. SD291]|uniref:NUDIX domain-containing protein n=1 Tax=Microbacterium sp. SD291 TaxID=2782007 RepID=UPI001A96F43E|nr:NUDIX domain-containing protein [Microbacterium sp. SD291]MBO0980623.1 NUDIX domain-containing protein [Microbacterium sp. SD291]